MPAAMASGSMARSTVPTSRSTDDQPGHEIGSRTRASPTSTPASTGPPLKMGLLPLGEGGARRAVEGEESSTGFEAGPLGVGGPVRLAPDDGSRQVELGPVEGPPRSSARVVGHEHL